MNFTRVHGEFAEALLDAGRPLPAGLTSHSSTWPTKTWPAKTWPTKTWPAKTWPTKRFAVYRNNVAFGLIRALRTRFPVVERIVGEEFFAGMAQAFVSAHPPRSPLLMRYGDEFADFISDFAPAAELVYLPDVARLEAARTRAYHAADAERLDPAVLQRLDASALPDLRILLHPSVELVRSPHPIVTIWAMNSGEAELAAIDENEAQDALVMRAEPDVLVRLLPPGGAAFLGALSRGATLGEAADLAGSGDGRFDLAANLAGLIGSGILSRVVTAEGDQLR
jgi:hypothetical protein